jgi:hypothetical protein
LKINGSLASQQTQSGGTLWASLNNLCMKYTLLFFIIPLFSLSQPDTTRVVIVQENKTEIDTVETDIYTDYENDYSIQKPKWLKINRELPSNRFGGTMPAVNGIVNAIMITALKKNRFQNFEDFVRIYITGNTFGQPMLMNEQFTFYGRNEKDLKKIKHGVSSRIFYLFKNKVYHNQFVLLETSSAYLFVHFCATPETYDENLKKFNEFLKGLKIE